MKKFFDIHFPFNRLQFNITLIVSILVFALIYYLQSTFLYKEGFEKQNRNAES